MQANFQSAISQIIPYDLNTIIKQIYQYKCFEVNINRALLLGDNKNVAKICLINGYWFNHWKKVSCYQIMKNEVDLNFPNNNDTFNILSYVGPNPQSPIPNPQSPIPNPHLIS